MALRESIVENFAGDLEYNPRRGALYLGLAAGSLCFWINSPAEIRFTAIPLIFALGGVPLLIKGIFLSRKSSEAIGLTHKELANLPLVSRGKGTPSIRNLAAQILQDFGAGPFLLWPFLNVGKEIDSSWNDPPRLAVFAAGLYFFRWLDDAPLDLVSAAIAVTLDTTRNSAAIRPLEMRHRNLWRA